MSEDMVTPIICERRGSSPTLKQINDSCIVIWLDPDRILIDDSNCKFDDQGIDDHSDPIYHEIDACIDFLTDLEDQNAFLVLFERNFVETLVPLIDNIPQLDSIYIFCSNNNNSIHNKSQIKNWKKVRGIFTELSSIYNELDEHIRQYELDLTPISIVSASDKINFHELDQSFVYSMLLKEILLQMKFDKQAKEEFVNYLRILYANNKNQLHAIEQFKENYALHSPIWWYTKEFFIYSTINRALKTQDLEPIIKIGFFMQDLHQQIAQIHVKTYQSTKTPTIIMYRGQGMLNIDFENLINNAGGLLSFNSFLSANKNRQTSLFFAERSTNNPEVTGVLFQMRVDSLICSAPFAVLDDISYFEDSKEEILFSIYTVFRIDELYQINERLWQVNLTLTSDEYDERLKSITDFIRTTAPNPKGWLRLGKFNLKIGELNKAEYIYQILLKTKSEDPWTFAHIHHYLGLIFQQKKDLSQALFHYEQSISMKLKYLPSNHYGLSSTYNNIGMILEEQGHFDRALEYFKRSLYIELDSPHSDQLSIATQYNTIGFLFQNQGKYAEALDNYERSLNIRIVYLPSQHPDLAISYANIAIAHYSMDDFLSSLLYARKALYIAEKSFPSDHPLISEYHHIIATTLESLHQYDEAIKHAQFAVRIARETLSSDDSQIFKYKKTLKSLRQKCSQLLFHI